MEALAGAVPAKQLGQEAYGLYERFRPPWGGWGAKTDLDLQQIRGLAATWGRKA